ncbi:MAG: T9SS type A sorting domain-containing protein [Bacteroidales bacterium]|nr:T9SS type A sorting domain-containing protein [Candidatus Colimorpha onthohippi]
MKHSFLFVLVIAVCGSLAAQTAVVPLGADVSVSSVGSASISVGQVACQLASDPMVEFTAQEGVQQPYTVTRERIDGVVEIPYDINVFPNPTNHSVTFRASQAQALSCTLFTVSGQVISSMQSQNGEGTFDLSRYAAGSYMLRVVDGDGRQQNFKVIKR